MLGSTMFYKLLVRKIRFCEHGCLWTPICHPPLKIDAFVDIRYLYSILVAGTDGFHSG